MTNVNLGRKAKCKITGYEGLVVSYTEWLNGCNRYAIQAPVDGDGKVPAEYWVDEEQIEFACDASVPLASRTGGPTPVPVRSQDPAR